MDPISPELVLVDPELARVERARLQERALLADVPTAPAVAPRTAAPPRGVPGAGKALLLPVVLASGFLLGVLVSRSHSRPASASVVRGPHSSAIGSTRVPAATRQPVGASTSSVRAAVVTKPRHRARRALRLPTRASVERRLLAVAFAAPRGRLPPSFIDSKTGLPENNLQAACRRSRERVGYECVLQMEGRPGSVAVLYGYDGRGHARFTWQVETRSRSR